VQIDGQHTDTALATVKLQPLTYDCESSDRQRQTEQMDSGQVNVVWTRSKTNDAAQATHNDSDQPTPPQEQDEWQSAIKEMDAIDLREIGRDDRHENAQSSADEFRTEQRNDRSLESFWARAKAGSNQFKIVNGILYRKIDDKINLADEYALVVPHKFPHELLNSVHSSAHQGIRKCTQRLQCHYFWPKQKQTVVHYVKCCKTCQMVKPQKVAERVPLEPLVFKTHAFDVIFLDIMGGSLERTRRGNKYILLLCCAVSKFPFAIPLRNLRAKTHRR